MNAIGLNPIKLDAIGLDPIRMNAIRLGVPVASSGSGRPYIDPELLSHVKMAISTWGKTNDDTDRAILKDLSGNGNDMRLLNFGFAEGSGYGLPGTDFEGWLCTDGVDDMIESVKPVSEMLEGSNEITVVSIIHQISFDPKNNLGFTNYINYQKDSSTRMYFRNNISDIGKTGIYGYTYDGTTLTGIYNILGDKADYNTVKSNNIDQSVFNGKLSVCGCTSPGGYLSELSQIAYAGGFIANKVLTTDEINQIIAYYNLDRPGQIIKPQLYYNIKKQGITNDNHAEFNDQLIDFINGHNIQLNNIGWEGESGINSYPVVFGANKTWGKMASSNNTDFIFELTGNSIHLTKADDNLALLFTYVYKDGTVNEVSIPTFKLKVTGLKEGQNVVYNYVSEDNVSDITSIRITEDGEYVCPKSTIFVPEEILSNVWIGFKVNSENIDLDITIEVLPTIEHALSLDGINDFGKVTGLPVLKDYTVAALRKWLYDDSVTSTETGSIVSKSKVGNGGAFILEQTFNRNPSRSSAFSFGTVNSLMNNDKLNEESFTYQTKYSYNGNPIQAGAGIDSDSVSC